MKQNRAVLGISVAAFFAVTMIAISEMPNAMAKPDANGQPDLGAVLFGFSESSSDAKGMAMFWFDDDSNPTSIRYKIVLNKIDVGDNPGKGLDELLTNVHIHYAPSGIHQGMHLYNILGPADDQDDGKIAGDTLTGVWDAADIDSDWMEAEHMHHSSKPLTALNPNGKTILENLCTGNTDVNIHTDANSDGAIRGVILPHSDACEKLGF